jgi:hypothetical protein
LRTHTQSTSESLRQSSGNGWPGPDDAPGPAQKPAQAARIHQTADLNRTFPGWSGWSGYFKHAKASELSGIDGWIRMRLRTILRKRRGLKGRGRGIDHQRWSNRYFKKLGL